MPERLSSLRVFMSWTGSGRLVMVTRNNRTLRLFYGDIGVALPDADGRLPVHDRVMEEAVGTQYEIAAHLALGRRGDAAVRAKLRGLHPSFWVARYRIPKPWQLQSESATPNPGSSPNRRVRAPEDGFCLAMMRRF